MNLQMSLFSCPACDAEPTKVGGWRDVCEVCHGRPVGRPSGKELKQKGIAKVVQRFPAYVEEVRNAIRFAADTREQFTADDVRARLTTEPPSPNLIGATFSAVVKAGEIELAGGFTRSTRPAAHGRLLPIWRKAK